MWFFIFLLATGNIVLGVTCIINAKHLGELGIYLRDLHYRIIILERTVIHDDGI